MSLLAALPVGFFMEAIAFDFIVCQKAVSAMARPAKGLNPSEDTRTRDRRPATADTAVSGCLPRKCAGAIVAIVCRLRFWVQAIGAGSWSVIAIGQKLRFQLGHIAIKENDDFGVACVCHAAILPLPQKIVVAAARCCRSTPYVESDAAHLARIPQREAICSHNLLMGGFLCKDGNCRGRERNQSKTAC